MDGDNDGNRKKAAKRPTAREEIKITIDIGTFEASPAELFRLKEFVNNQVLTWAKYDTKCAVVAPGVEPRRPDAWAWTWRTATR